MIAHANGYGGTYYDCYPVGTPGNASTYSSQIALDAANSDAAQSGMATIGWNCGNVASVCKSVDPAGKTGTCTCWAYTGSPAGHTNFNNSGCLCSQTSGPTWN
jgi:hypothetical protein